MSVTLKEIAHRAGVSRQAVAAALCMGGSSKVSPATSRRIREIAEELRYSPNQAARQLKGAASYTIGIYGVPYASVLDQIFFNELSVILDCRGYNLLACYGMNEEAAELAIRKLFAKGVDGMVVTTKDNPLAPFRGARVPSVFCPPARVDGFDLAVDHAAGTYHAARKLLALGRRRFVYMPPCLYDDISDQPNREKRNGLRRALAEAGLELVTVTVEECGGDASAILARLRALAADAVFASNDYFAGRLLSVLLAGGWKVPDDVMVVGYDGLSLCDLCAVPLATVVQPTRRRAEVAAALLLERIDGKDVDAPPRGELLEPYFYPSASCGVANPRTEQFPLHNSFSSLEMIWGDCQT